MSKASMFYREIAPAPEISHLVLSFWEFSVKSDDFEPIIHEIFPEGCISLIYKRNEFFGINTLFIHGLSLEIFKTQVFAGDVFWGVRFMPSSCAKIMRCHPAEIQSHPLVGSSEFSHLTEGLPEKFAACRNCDEAIEIYKNQLQKLSLAPEDIDDKIAEAVQIIEKSNGEIKIAEIAEALKLSSRQLERRFKKSAGLSPKQFVRARRIRATAVSLVEENSLNWANRASEMGFTDQSHLSHEFSSLIGRSPNDFAEKVKLIEHGNLVK